MFCPVLIGFKIRKCLEQMFFFFFVPSYPSCLVLKTKSNLKPDDSKFPSTPAKLSAYVKTRCNYRIGTCFGLGHRHGGDLAGVACR